RALPSPILSRPVPTRTFALLTALRHCRFASALSAMRRVNGSSRPPPPEITPAADASRTGRLIGAAEEPGSVRVALMELLRTNPAQPPAYERNGPSDPSRRR